jgi:hypothetical protein
MLGLVDAGGRAGTFPRYADSSNFHACIGEQPVCSYPFGFSTTGRAFPAVAAFSFRGGVSGNSSAHSCPSVEGRFALTFPIVLLRLFSGAASFEVIGMQNGTRTRARNVGRSSIEFAFEPSIDPLASLPSAALPTELTCIGGGSARRWMAVWLPLLGVPAKCISGF